MLQFLIMYSPILLLIGFEVKIFALFWLWNLLLEMLLILLALKFLNVSHSRFFLIFVDVQLYEGAVIQGYSDVINAFNVYT